MFACAEVEELAQISLLPGSLPALRTTDRAFTSLIYLVAVERRWTLTPEQGGLSPVQRQRFLETGELGKQLNRKRRRQALSISPSHFFCCFAQPCPSSHLHPHLHLHLHLHHHSTTTLTTSAPQPD